MDGEKQCPYCGSYNTKAVGDHYYCKDCENHFGSRNPD